MTLKHNTRKQVAELRKNEACEIAVNLLTEIKWQGGAYKDRLSAEFAAHAKVGLMTTREVYAMLKECGYTFDTGLSRWQAAGNGVAE